MMLPRRLHDLGPCLFADDLNPQRGGLLQLAARAGTSHDQIGLGRTFEIDGATLERPFGRGLNVQILVEDVDAMVLRGMAQRAGVVLRRP